MVGSPDQITRSQVLIPLIVEFISWLYGTNLPFITILPSSWYDLNNTERYIKYKTIICIIVSHSLSRAFMAQLDASYWWSEGCGFDPCWVSNFLSWRLIMKHFLHSFSPFCWFKKYSCQFLVNECAKYWLTTEGISLPSSVWLGKLITLDMTPLGWLGRKTSTHSLSAPGAVRVRTHHVLECSILYLP